MLALKVFNVLIKVTAYLLLSVGALAFVIRSINKYLEYKTSLAITQESLTLSDIPTIMLCHDHFVPQNGDITSGWGIERKYGRDFVF